MDKSAIKRYAIWARKELIEKVSQKAQQYGIEADKLSDASADTVNGYLLAAVEKKQRQALIIKIDKEGFEQVIEEVAFTWFNRFIAIRFMEVNGYLPSHLRVFSDDNNIFKPQILSEALHLDLKGLDKQVVYQLKEANKNEDLYKYLLITQCNDLNTILPGMFQKIADYTELLLPDYLLRDGSVIEQLVTSIPEKDWTNQVQILGWLYQCYNSELKDVVFGRPSGTRISRDDMPAATQLFTPDWIVKYMVENAVNNYFKGELHRHQDLYKYVVSQEFDGEDAIKIEDIKCIDPCVGSGHVLVYLFDVLMQLYIDKGYSTRDALCSIIKNNIYGLDLDERAVQLAYFSLMMKARQHDRTFFRKGLHPNIHYAHESNSIDQYCIDYFCNGDEKIRSEIQAILSDMRDAKEYGSLLTIHAYDWKRLYERFDEIRNDIHILKDNVLNNLLPIIENAEILSMRYDLVITNPPYLKADSLTAKVADFIIKYHESAKYDIYAAFIYRCHDYLKNNGVMAMITMHNFMFAPSFLSLRDDVKYWDWKQILHLGSRAFSEISGEVVQTASYIIKKDISNNPIIVIDVTDAKIPDEKEAQFLFKKEADRYLFNMKDLDSIPGHAFGYSLSKRTLELFENNQQLKNFGTTRAGVVTGADDKFVRYWFEPDYRDITFDPQPEELYKYVLFSKGGTFTRWYGNAQNVLKLTDMWDDTKTNKSVRRGDRSFYYKKGIGWSQMGGGTNKAFSLISDCVCKTTTPMFYPKSEDYLDYILGYLNSGIPPMILKALNPTLSILTTDIENLPFLYNDSYSEQISELVNECICLTEEIYATCEENWQFKRLPIIDGRCISDEVKKYISRTSNINKKINECLAKLQRIFLDIFDIKHTNAITIDAGIFFDEKDIVKRLLSYAVGCIMGRYSLDKKGIVFAGGNWSLDSYKNFIPDKDGIIPICCDEYFADDIVNVFCSFIEKVYGSSLLEENLRYIADVLGGKGSSRDCIREYFISDKGFFIDHSRMYSKRPIYWMLSSGPNLGFKALIYIHRYQQDTFARIRTDYVHELQSRYSTDITGLKEKMDTVSGSERVKVEKNLADIVSKDEELHAYEEVIHHLADQMISLDIDDGVKINYEKVKELLVKI